MIQEKKQIELRARWGRQQGPTSLIPVRDAVTGRLKGVTVMNEDERRKAARPVDENTARKISDGLILDLSNEVDRTDWEWIQYNKEIAMSWEDALENPQVLFYVNQPEKELQDRLKKADLAFEAEKLVREKSEESRLELCRLLGLNARGFTPSDIKDFLLGKCKSDPQSVLEAASDPDQKEKLFLMKLVDAGKVKKESNGMFKYGDIILGLNSHAAVQWFKDVKNRDILVNLLRSLKEESAVTTSILAEIEAEENTQQ